MNKLFSASVLTAALWFASPAFALTGEVVSITDGDTIKVLTDARQPVDVRLASIDAPEKGMPFGQAAKAVLSQLVGRKRVHVTEDTHDRYGRTIGLVTLEENGLNVNERMVMLGYAHAYYCEEAENPAGCRYLNPRDRNFRLLQKEAERLNIGLWADHEKPQAPWEWRKQKSKDERDMRTQSCSEFKTCDEAKAALAAGNTRIDGNGDGVPCEALCRDN